MKRKVLLALGILLIIAILGLIWWNIPVHILDADANSITRIEIYNDNSGNCFSLEQPKQKEQINYIVENFQHTALRKEKEFGDHSSSALHLIFYKTDGHQYKKFSLISNNCVRKGLFFYTDKHAQLCYDYISALIPNR